MKNFVLILVLAIAVLSSGCAKEASAEPQASPPAECTAQSETQAEAEGALTAENPASEGTEPEQGAFPAGENDDELAEYMAAIESRAGQIETELDEAMTQMEMTAKAGELYVHWDDALNYLWAELKAVLPGEDFSKLLDEQLVWIAQKEEAIEEAGKQFEGGTAYSMAKSLQGAQVTQERVYELYELLKQAKMQ